MKNLFPMAEKRKLESDIENKDLITKRRKTTNLTKDQTNPAEKAAVVAENSNFSSKIKNSMPIRVKESLPVKNQLTSSQVTSSKKFCGKSLHVANSKKSST